MSSDAEPSPERDTMQTETERIAENIMWVFYDADEPVLWTHEIVDKTNSDHEQTMAILEKMANDNKVGYKHGGDERLWWLG